MITPQLLPNPQIKPKWQASVGIMESVVQYNCRIHGFPRPVLAAPMWEGGGNRVMDLSGHGNAGQLNGNPDWYGNGLYFDGSGDSVNLQDKLIPASDDFTLTGMIKVDNVSTWRTIFSQFTSGQSGRFIFEVNRYTRELLVYIGSSLYSGLFLNLGQTYNVVLVRQNNVFKFYLDGVKGTDRANSISIYQGENTFIGDTTGGYDFHGGVYGASIFLEALSHRQIKFLNDNPYFMYQIPEELYGWTGGAAPTGNPYWYYKMLKERN